MTFAPPHTHTTSNLSNHSFSRTLIALAVGGLFLAPVWAASTITESGFSEPNDTLTAGDDAIGSIDLSNGTGKTFNLKGSADGSPIVIAPTLPNGAAISINNKSNQSTLHIESGVKIEGTTDNRLTTTGSSLITVGDGASGTPSTGGHLQINGDLTISNIDVNSTTGTSLVTVGDGIATTATGSSLTVGNITVDNVSLTNTKQSNPKTDSAVFRFEGTTNTRYGDARAQITSGTIDIRNAQADNGFCIKKADVSSKAISFNNGVLKRGVQVSTDGNVTITEGISGHNTEFKTNFIEVKSADNFSVGNGGITYDGSGLAYDPEHAGDNHFIYLSSTDKVTVQGGIHIQNLTWRDNIIYTNALKDATFGDITVEHVKQAATSSSNGIKFEDSAVSVGALTVSDTQYLATNNNQYGITFAKMKKATVKSIDIDTMLFNGTEPPITITDGNGGLRLDKTTFTGAIDHITIKNIDHNSATDNKQTYYGIKSSNSSLDVGQVLINNIKTEASQGKAYGAHMSGGTLKYNSIQVSDISAGERASGLHLENAVTPLGENSSIGVSRVKANHAFGLFLNNSSTAQLTGQQLLINGVTGKQEAVGTELRNTATIDTVQIQNIKAYDEAKGLSLWGSKAKLDAESLIIESVTLADDAVGNAYGALTYDTRQNNFLVDNLRITGVSGNNATEAYGIKNETGSWTGSLLNVINIASSSSGKAVGIESTSDQFPGSISEGPTSFDYDVMTISSVSGGNAIGIFNKNKGIDATISSHRLIISDVSGTDSAIGLQNAFYSNNYNAVANVSITEDAGVEHSGLLGVQNIVATDGNATGVINENLIDTVNLSVNFVEAKNGNAVGVSSNSSLTVSGQTSVSNVTGTTQAIGLSLLEDQGSLGETFISQISAADEAIGLNIESAQEVAFSKSVVLDDITASAGMAAAIKANNLKLSGGLKITGIKGNTETIGILAKPTEGAGVILEAIPDVPNVVEGDLVTMAAVDAQTQEASTGKITASFVGTGSSLKGATDLSYKDGDPDGMIHLAFKDSRWDVTKTSNLSSLSMDNSTLAVSLNLAEKNAPDTTQVDVKGEAKGTLNLALTTTGTIGEDFRRSADWILQQESGTLTVGEVLDPVGAALDYSVRFFEDGAPEDSQGSTSSMGKKGQWYVVVNRDEPTDPEEPPISSEVHQILSLGASVNQGLGMLSETEDLRMRMGDVRNGDTDGLWVRTYARKDSAHGSFGNGFEQDAYGIHIGADHVVKTGNEASWLFGGAFHCGRSDMDGVADAGGGEADVDQYTFKAYATYMKDNGAFVDLVLHAGYYDTELTGLANNKMAGFKADYSNWGYGISAEAGHRFEFGETASAWYVEPTAQLTWFHAEGKDFTTSTGLAVSQGDADFITGRLGAAMGKTFALGTDSDPLASYFSVGLKGGMLYQFDGDQTITAHGTDDATVHCDAMDLKGARAYYGLTADWKIDDAWRVYGQISREEGSGYTKDYDASIGVRYAF